MRLSYLFLGLPLSLALVGCSNSPDTGTGGVTRITGGGATFVDPIMQEWKQGYKAARGIEIDYQPKGSGNGINMMTNGNIDFGCSDAPMKKGQLDAALKERGEVVHIPLIMGPVVPIYNLPTVKATLNFSGPVLADIYLGKIKKWNDAAIQNLNKGVDLPDLAIFPVYRAEASGTTNIFKEYLAKSSAEFKETVGVSTEPTWPKGVGGGERDNAGVANRVKASPGTIGYVELRFAKQNGVAFGAVTNRKGKPILGSPESVTAAANAAMDKPQTSEPYSLHELTFSLTDPDGDDAYPISGVSYCIVYKKQTGSMGKALVDFLRWAVHDGQGYAQKLDYAPLPEGLVKKIDVRLGQIQVAP